MARDHPNVVSIPPGAAFLTTLVRAVLDGSLLPGHDFSSNPLALSSLTIWVPTRRAARALASEFVTQLAPAAALMPDIRVLGDDADEALSLDAEQAGLDDRDCVTGVERQLVLGRLIAAWSAKLNAPEGGAFETVSLPGSFSAAVRFASDLATLMDTVATEGVSWDKLGDINADDQNAWWGLTLDFLKIATKFWPDWLSERKLVEASALRTGRLEAQAELYASGAAQGPVIAAGSTGSIPATARLLREIAHRPDGVVVLPGLDRDMEDAVWQALDLPDNPLTDTGPAQGHPQFGLRRLIGHLGTTRAEVTEQSLPLLNLADPESNAAMRLRERLVSAAMLPSAHTHRWPDILDDLSSEAIDQAFEHVALIEAEHENEEALAIALCLRQALEQPERRAALVTPDRNLARRVTANLRRFGITVDDSAGQPLTGRPHGTLLRLVTRIAFDQAATEELPLLLATLVKHPLVSFGGKPATARRAGRVLELAVLRGSTGTIHIADLPNLMQQVRADLPTRHHPPQALTRLEDEDWQEAEKLAETLARIFADRGTDQITADCRALARMTTGILEAVASHEEEGLVPLYGGAEGQALSAFMQTLLEVTEPIDVPSSQWPDIVDALMAGRVVRPHGKSHPRLVILGPLEARLQTFDRVVLAGLNETTWPAAANNDPFLSRPMKSAMGLPAPERRTGLAAHDFQMLMGMEEVVLSRSKRVDNTPTIASRWVQRVLVAIGEPAAKAMKANGETWLSYAQRSIKTDSEGERITRPAPKPPVSSRPRRLSVTAIERWIRDPYDIYASRILNLEALAPLTAEIGPRERGTLYHGILENFVKRDLAESGHDPTALLREIAEKQFEAAGLPPDIQLVWMARFLEAADGFLAWHRDRRDDLSYVHVEAGGKLPVAGGAFHLTGLADRIDLYADGSATIIDYKTGTSPTRSEATQLLAPQLPLEAAMVHGGAFDQIPQGTSVRDLTYLRLKTNGEFVVDALCGNPEKDSAADLGNRALTRLEALIAAYDDPDQAYLSRARPWKSQSWTGDFDHLARVAEWKVGDDEEGGA